MIELKRCWGSIRERLPNGLAEDGITLGEKTMGGGHRVV